MKHITFITGGQRSGKSSFAQELAEKASPHPIYLATARRWDDDFEQRIHKHQADRGKQWKTIEEEITLSRHNLSGQTILLDCITLWLTNIFHDNNYNADNALQEAKKEWKTFVNQNFNLIVVSNELGMGIHASDETSRKFADIHGWLNQYIAKQADTVYLMVSGIPVKIK